MNLLALLTAKYGYFILFPISVIEGPIVTIVAGFLASLGLFNFFLVYFIVLAGDFSGDTGAYAIGRWGAKFFQNYLKKHEEKITAAKEYFSIHHNKAIVMSKLISGLGDRTFSSRQFKNPIWPIRPALLFNLVNSVRVFFTCGNIIRPRLSANRQIS